MKSKLYTRLTMVFTTILMFTFIASSQTTITVQINAPEDDDDEIELTIYGAKEATISPEGFTDADFNVTSHPITDASVSWEPAPWLTIGEAGPSQQTPDISSIITEIIAVDGWASGNDLMILLHDTSTVKAHREADSQNGNAAGAPILNVTFTGGGTGVASVRDEFSNSIYPNPTEGKLNIVNPSTDKFGYEIFSINGKLVASRQNITGPATEVDLSNFARGVYFVDVRTAERTETHKLIVKSLYSSCLQHERALPEKHFKDFLHLIAHIRAVLDY